MQYYWDFITGDFHQNGLLQSVHINKTKTDWFPFVYGVTPDIK
jgi:hypothetical protein